MLRQTVLLVALMIAVPVGAQSLPDWAAPLPPPSTLPPAPPPVDESPSFDEEPLEAVPTLPGNPTQVPVDGGLGLLALAGAGYAARRLRQR
ncbi:MAG: hypothetical protein AAFQ53_11140 [Bacteroidota bacterium]